MSLIKCDFCSKNYNDKMKFCPFCGGANKKSVPDIAPECPRCGVGLVPHEYRNTVLDICPECSGLWLDSSEFVQLSSERDAFLDESVPYEFKRKPLSVETGYLACPRCRNLMNRKNFRNISGVLYDVCNDHGVWLDEGELEQIRCFVANGGLNKDQDRRIAENSENIQSIASSLRGVSFMQKTFHFWEFKRWLFNGFRFFR